MFESMPGGLIAAYLFFSLALFYQQRQARHFKGESQVFLLALNISVLLAILTGLAFFIYYGYTVRWYLPFLLFGVGLLLKLLWFAVEASLHLREAEWIFSLAGFVVWPVAAYSMFQLVPRSF